MGNSYAGTVESPCRNCKNVHASKEEYGKDCDKLRAFQDAILRYDETSIRNFAMKLSFSRG
jgi:hypothetical protein